MFGPIQAVIFDFDGTLVNTMPSVTEGIGKAIEAVTGTRPEVSELTKTFGPAPQDVFRRWVPEERVPEAMRVWLEFEDKLGRDSMEVFTGVPEMLAGLVTAGIRIALFTGRDRRGTERILRVQGWEKFFPLELTVCGDDGLPTKPAPDGILKLLPLLQVKASETLMVGDHPHDMAAGKSAGTKVGAALWDLPTSEKTHRANFKKAWEKWDPQNVDLRLVQPGALLEWLAKPLSPT